MTDGRLIKRYEALLTAVPQAVWVMSADGVITRLMGHDRLERLWQPDSGTPWMSAVHPKDREWFQRLWRRATEKGISVDAVVRIRLEKNPDRYRHIRLIAARVRHQDEEEWVGTAIDAEEDWRARMREKLLARMASVPAAEDLSEAFMTAAAAVVPELADAVAIFHIQDPGPLPDNTASAEEAMARVGLAPGLPSLPPLGTDFLLGRLARRALRAQRAELLSFPEGEPPANELSAASVDWLRQAGATSVALLPIVVDGRTVALASTATCQGTPPADEADLALLQDLFQQMTGPLRRTLELQSVRRTALALQQSFLSPPADIPGLAIVALYRPADSTAEVGGDWYDAVKLSDDALAVSIGDIAGHDLDAAMAMGRVNSILRGLAFDSGPKASPAETLQRLDRIVQALDGPPLVTAIHAVLRRTADHTWEVILSTAGHPPPLLIPSDAPSRYVHGLSESDPPLCVPDPPRRTDFRATLRAGDTLLLFTDGLVETPRTDIGRNLHRLRERTDMLVRDDTPLPDLVHGLLPPVRNRRDDIAVIALRAVSEQEPTDKSTQGSAFRC